MKTQTRKTRVLISGQDPSLPGGMAKYVGGLRAYLDTVAEIETHYLNETQVKGRAGMTSANRLAAIGESGRLLRAFRRSLRRHKPDIVHLHMAHGLSVLEKSGMAALAVRAGVPAVVHLHGAGLDTALAAMPAWQRRWLNRTLARPNHVVALSGGMKRLTERCLTDVEATVIPNAVALVRPRPPLRSPVTFGFIGFMDGRKGEGDLIRALARPEAPAGALLLAGDGPKRAEAEALAARLGLADRVDFLGNIDGAAKDDFFRRIDVLCLPSYAENLPIALLEAMGYGRPVIATRVGAIPEMITHGEQGWLVPPGDLEALAAALAEAAHAEENGRRGLAAWETVAERFTWERNGPQLVRLYQTVHRGLEKADSDGHAA